MQNSLKAHRKAKNLTQEELSEHSGISVRTIQRLEKGLTPGSAHTIKTLAKALEVKSSDIVISQSEIQEPYDDLHKVKLMNFSILSVLMLPFGNLILPTLVYFFNKKNYYVKTIGKRIISIQILSTFFLVFLSVSIFLLVGRGNGAIPKPVPIIYFMYTTVSILIVVKTSRDLDRNRKILKIFPDLI